MATTKTTKVSRASTASAKGGARKPKVGARKPKVGATPSRDVLEEMLADVNSTLHAIGDVIANMPSHGDLHDDHVELAKSVKKLAKETHSRVKAAREAKKKKATT